VLATLVEQRASFVDITNLVPVADGAVLLRTARR